MANQGSTRITESERGPNRGEAYGVAAVTQVLKGVEFPVEKQELIQEFGNEKIQWTKDSKPQTLKECLQQVDRDKFNSVTEITSSISKSQ